jgi:hypothetical protein
MGEWKFNRMSSRTGKWKPDEEVVTSAVPVIIEPHLFAQVQPSFMPVAKGRRSTRDDRAGPADRSCRVRDLQQRDDVADRHLEDRCRPSVLCVLDLRPKGQDGL